MNTVSVGMHFLSSELKRFRDIDTLAVAEDTMHSVNVTLQTLDNLQIYEKFLTGDFSLFFKKLKARSFFKESLRIFYIQVRVSVLCCVW